VTRPTISPSQAVNSGCLNFQRLQKVCSLAVEDEPSETNYQWLMYRAFLKVRRMEPPPSQRDCLYWLD